MMLSGAALLATVYAIIADRVLAARVEYLLGRRRVNLFGHTIVVGLGKVGYRVARDLENLGLDIVGIDVDGDSENVNAAKALFPVIVGDAARTSILNKAAIDTADTVLALTEDSLLNLSVALNILEHNPNIRAIVRTYDTGLAEKFVSFGLEKAISTSAIAAPVFVDAAIYPNVQGSFKSNGQDIMVARYLIDSDSDLLGKTPIQISDEYGLAIVATANNMHSDYDAAKHDKPLHEGQKVLGLLVRTV
jgi:Trk K+ transport system NAD-binding subunit